MEISSRLHEHREKNPSPTNSPSSSVSNCMTSTYSNNNGVQISTPPLTPKTPIPRSDPNPYPTTFVQADTSTFKQVVQMLTGSSESTKPPQDPIPPSKNFQIPPIKQPPKKQGFKLYERRNSYKNSLMINTLMPNFVQNHNNPAFSPRKPPEILSPSLLDFPSLALSPVTPLNEDAFDKSSSPSLGNSSEEEKAIAEKGFYLHPSPMTTPRDSEPQLLPLFPLTTARVSESTS